MSFFTSSLLPLSHQLNKNRLYFISSRLYGAAFDGIGLNFDAFLLNCHGRMTVCDMVVDWDAFASWMESRGFSKKHLSQSLSYARKYVDFILGRRNLAELEGLKCKRKVLAGLSNLAKFLGKYGWWMQRLRDAGISWTEGNGNGEWVFKKIYDNETDGLDSWIKEVQLKTESWVYDYVLLLSLTGVRPIELVAILNLVLDGKLKNCVNEQYGVFECFKYPQLFMRKGKKLYFVVLTDKIQQLLENWEREGRRLTYDVVSGKIERAGLQLRLYHLRKNFATWLWKKGVPVEIIDLVQGRSGETVFARHYFRPSFLEEIEKVRRAVEELQSWFMIS